jgi:predicted permease
VLTLALGLGANTAIYALLDAVVLRPLPYPDAERLVVVTHPVSGVAPDAVFGLSVAGYFHFRDHNRSFEDIGVYNLLSLNLSGDGEPERIRLALSTASLLNVLGARPALGRLFTEAEDEPPRAQVVVLSHDFWMRRYGGDPGVLGRTIQVDGRGVEVVGVFARGFQLPRSRFDLWAPRGLDRNRPPENMHAFSAIARLRGDVSPAAAVTDVRRLTAQFTTLFPRAYDDAFMRDTRFDVAVVPLRDDVIGDMSRVLWILLGSVTLVLAIACANVANLFLVRAEARRREVAIKTALGAGRRELAWHYLAESMLLALIAGVAGLTLAHAGLRLLVALSPASIPRLDEVGIGASSMAFALVISLCAGLLFGTIPLLRGTAHPRMLREGGRGGTSSRRTHVVRSALVAAQVALALVLLSSAALMLRSFRNLRGVDAGIDATGVLSFELSIPPVRYETDEAVNSFYRELTQRLEQLDGVISAGATTWLPAAGSGGCAAVFLEGRPLGPSDAPPCVIVGKTTPGFVESVAMRIQGRTPSWSENGGTGTAVVTRALADRFWPGENALGKGIRVWGPGEPYYRVVGVAEGVRADLDKPPVEAVFFPMLALEGAPLWQPSWWSVILVRTTADSPERYLPLVKRVMADLDPQIPIANVQSMESVVAKGIARRTFTMLLLGIAAGMALLLSVVGLYGVISYVVGQRTAELGIRMALGAPAAKVRALVIRQAVTVVAIGIALGLAGAFASTRALNSLLFEVSPTDPAVLGAVSILLAAIALAASWAPAYRASRVDPVESLRAQ